MKFVIRSSLFLLLLAMFVKCVPKKEQTLDFWDTYRAVRHHDPLYLGERNYRPFYIVDTIDIQYPVVVRSDLHGGPFVFNIEKLREDTDSLEFFLQPDVFVYWPEPGWFFSSRLHKTDPELFNYPDEGGCNFLEPIKINEYLWVHRFIDKPVFVLALVNANHYHKTVSSGYHFNIPLEYPKYTYIKVVFPLCE